MANVTFQVLEGVDKGRAFRNLTTPVTIGREEGNVLRLNDERVSRFHAKVQCDSADIILTDLESTNGTRVNGTVVQIRRLRAGDQITVGRTRLRFGSDEEIRAREASLRSKTQPLEGTLGSHSLIFQGPATVQAQTFAPEADPELDFDVSVNDPVTGVGGELYAGQRQLPPLPQKMSPAQAARVAEILEFLHRGLTAATENIQSDDEGTQITLNFADWQKILAVHMLLARYLRAVTDPDALDG
jgi:pSer/pThr/pTyr-binding forkhead associated (FHA) protein